MTDFNDLKPFTLAEFIRFRREQLGYTQSQMARKLEIPERQYGNWERGQNKPNLDSLIPLLRALNLRLRDLEPILDPRPQIRNEADE